VQSLSYLLPGSVVSRSPAGSTLANRSTSNRAPILRRFGHSHHTLELDTRVQTAAWRSASPASYSAGRTHTPNLGHSWADLARRQLGGRWKGKLARTGLPYVSLGGWRGKPWRELLYSQVLMCKSVTALCICGVDLDYKMHAPPAFITGNRELYVRKTHLVLDMDTLVHGVWGLSVVVCWRLRP
jgi:hypothetical protein